MGLWVCASRFFGAGTTSRKREGGIQDGVGSLTDPGTTIVCINETNIEN
jgi:hypothetical protein